VGVAFSQIVDTVPRAEQRGLAFAIREELNQWRADAYPQMTDMLLFLKRADADGLPVDACVGGWICRQLENDPRSSKQLVRLAASPDCAKMVGWIVISAFAGYWKTRFQ